MHVLVASTAQEVFIADRCYFAVAAPADQDRVRDRKFARRHFAPAIVDRPAKGIKARRTRIAHKPEAFEDRSEAKERYSVRGRTIICLRSVYLRLVPTGPTVSKLLMKLVGREGIEPSTNGLRVRTSTILSVAPEYHIALWNRIAARFAL